MDGHRYCLTAPGCSRRWVIVRELAAHEVDEVNENAAELVGVDRSNMLKLRQAMLKLGIKRMLHSVSIGGGYSGDCPPPPQEWHKVSLAELESDGQYAYGKLFNVKDDGVLSTIYSKLHEVSAADVEAIMGKGQKVSLD